MPQTAAQQKRDPQIQSRGKARHWHYEVTASVANQTLDLAFVVALAGAAIPIPDHVVRQHRSKPLGAFTCSIGHDLRHKATVRRGNDPPDRFLILLTVVENGTRNGLEESKGMHVTVQPGLSVGRRIGANVAGMAV